MHADINEIRGFVQNGQIISARNKLIDLVFDSDNNELAIKVNAWCRSLYENKNEWSANIESGLHSLLDNWKVEDDSLSVYDAEKPVVTLSNISKTYSSGNFKISDVNISLRQGEIIGIVGENGNGKTTVLNIAAQNISKDSGNLLYHFLPAGNHDRYFIRQHIGFIPQRIDKWFGSLKESLHFAASCYGIYGDENEIRVEQILHRLDLWKFNKYKWKEISSGYKTRFEIARILLGKPKLLILDEPLANLDINTQQSLLNDLRNIAKSKRHPMAILMSSQQLHEIEKASDNIIFLKEGHCIFQSVTDKATLEGTLVELDVHPGDVSKLNLLNDAGFKFSFTGSFYLLENEVKEKADVVLKTLLNNGVRILYFRDISHSAKRFFNKRK